MSTMTSGFGQYHTNEPDTANPRKKLTPYAGINLAGIRALVDNPQQVEKGDAQWLIPSTLPSRTFAQQEQHGQYLSLWADLDTNPQPLAHVQSTLEFVVLDGSDYEIYASRSATPERQKGRILIPLAQPLTFDDWVLCQQELNSQLTDAGITPDPTNERSAQLCYLPNRGAFYESYSQRDGILFDPLKAWGASVEKRRNEIKAQEAKLEALRKAAAERREALNDSDVGDTIGTFKKSFAVQEILLRAGYDQRGEDFRHPGSESGSFSAHVKDGRVHSLSSSDPLYTGGSGGGAHDSFSAFCVLFAGGDTNAALKLAGDSWLSIGGEPFNKVKQREYMRKKERDEALAGFDIIQDEMEPRTYEEILGDAEKMDEDTPPADIQRIAVECENLSPIERRKVFMALKRSSGIPLGTLKEAMKANNGDEDEWDHLELATEVIRQVGAENIFEAQSFVWLWNGTGVWHKNEDRAVKQIVQNALPAHASEVFKSLVDGVTDVLRNEIYRPCHEFNIGPVDTVNCPNGEVALGLVWELHPHIKEHYRTTQIPVCYDPTAKAPRFDKFLSEIFSGDADADQKRNAVLQMIGYTLMAHCRYEKFIVLVGQGANGKSVLLSVLEALVGAKNVAGVQPSNFDNVFQRGHLHCKLANIVSEIRQGEVINDAALKGIVSGEPTTVEHKNKDPFEMRPFATCWFGTNHMPHTRDDSDGFFRRSLVVSFNNVFKPENGNADPNLKDKLMKELPGILNMALEAYAKAINLSGFTTPSSSLKAVDDWRLETDQVAQFVDEECEKRPSTQIKSSLLYAAYKEWAKAAGIHKEVTAKTFSQRLERLGVGKERTKNDRLFKGIYCSRALEGVWQGCGAEVSAMVASGGYKTW